MAGLPGQYGPVTPVRRPEQFSIHSPRGDSHRLSQAQCVSNGDSVTAWSCSSSAAGLQARELEHFRHRFVELEKNALQLVHIGAAEQAHLVQRQGSCDIARLRMLEWLERRLLRDLVAQALGMWKSSVLGALNFQPQGNEFCRGSPVERWDIVACQTQTCKTNLMHVESACRDPLVEQLQLQGLEHRDSLARQEERHTLDLRELLAAHSDALTQKNELHSAETRSLLEAQGHKQRMASAARDEAHIVEMRLELERQSREHRDAVICIEQRQSASSEQHEQEHRNALSQISQQAERHSFDSRERLENQIRESHHQIAHLQQSRVTLEEQHQKRITEFEDQIDREKLEHAQFAEIQMRSASAPLLEQLAFQQRDHQTFLLQEREKHSSDLKDLRDRQMQEHQRALARNQECQAKLHSAELVQKLESQHWTHLDALAQQQEHHADTLNREVERQREGHQRAMAACKELHMANTRNFEDQAQQRLNALFCQVERQGLDLREHLKQQDLEHNGRIQDLAHRPRHSSPTTSKGDCDVHVHLSGITTLMDQLDQQSQEHRICWASQAKKHAEDLSRLEHESRQPLVEQVELQAQEHREALASQEQRHAKALSELLARQNRDQHSTLAAQEKRMSMVYSAQLGSQLEESCAPFLEQLKVQEFEHTRSLETQETRHAAAMIERLHIQAQEHREALRLQEAHEHEEKRAQVTLLETRTAKTRQELERQAQEHREVLASQEQRHSIALSELLARQLRDQHSALAAQEKSTSMVHSANLSSQLEESRAPLLEQLTVQELDHTRSLETQERRHAAAMTERLHLQAQEHREALRHHEAHDHEDKRAQVTLLETRTAETRQELERQGREHQQAILCMERRHAASADAHEQRHRDSTSRLSRTAESHAFDLKERLTHAARESDQQMTALKISKENLEVQHRKRMADLMDELERVRLEHTHSSEWQVEKFELEIRELKGASRPLLEHMEIVNQEHQTLLHQQQERHQSDLRIFTESKEQEHQRALAQHQGSQAKEHSAELTQELVTQHRNHLDALAQQEENHAESLKRELERQREGHQRAMAACDANLGEQLESQHGLHRKAVVLQQENHAAILFSEREHQRDEYHSALLEVEKKHAATSNIYNNQAQEHLEELSGQIDRQAIDLQEQLMQQDLERDVHILNLGNQQESSNRQPPLELLDLQAHEHKEALVSQEERHALALNEQRRDHQAALTYQEQSLSMLHSVNLSSQVEACTAPVLEQLHVQAREHQGALEKQEKTHAEALSEASKTQSRERSDACVPHVHSADLRLHAQARAREDTLACVEGASAANPEGKEQLTPAHCSHPASRGANTGKIDLNWSLQTVLGTSSNLTIPDTERLADCPKDSPSSDLKESLERQCQEHKDAMGLVEVEYHPSVLKKRLEFQDRAHQEDRVRHDAKHASSQLPRDEPSRAALLSCNSPSFPNCLQAHTVLRSSSSTRLSHSVPYPLLANTPTSLPGISPDSLRFTSTQAIVPNCYISKLAPRSRHTTEETTASSFTCFGVSPGPPAPVIHAHALVRPPRSVSRNPGVCVQNSAACLPTPVPIVHVQQCISVSFHSQSK